jgi:terminase large subunit-like protein
MRTDSAAILRSAFSDSIRLGTLETFLGDLSAGELNRLHYDFELWARDDQLPPERAGGGAPWTVWLMLGGRGAGKTRAGAEWVRAIAQRPDACEARVALIGETLADTRAVMVEGVSGLLSVHPPEAKPLFEPSKRQVTWPNGAIAQLFSADDLGRCADRNSPRPGATSCASGAGRKRPGTCCNSACGWVRGRARW